MWIFIACSCFSLDDIFESYPGRDSKNIDPKETKEEDLSFHLDNKEPRNNRPSKEKRNNLPKNNHAVPLVNVSRRKTKTSR